MSNPFASPAPASGGIQWADVKGNLVLIEVLSVETGISTAFGATDAIRANVAVLDGPQQGEKYDDTLIFPKVLQGQLRSRVGQKVLGRVGQGNAKSGQSAPWLLEEAADADIKVGTDYLAGALKAPVPAGNTPPF
jgi:hypothetical protein